MTIPDAGALPQASLRLRLDHAALADNWQTLNRLSGAANAGAAIKADGYGLGALRVLKTLQAAGARDFFVAHWQEAAALLGHVDPARICVLHGPVTADDAEFARATGVRPMLNSLHQVRLWQDGGGGLCHVMVDSGINRLGLSLVETGDPLLAALDVDILASHLASADEDGPQNAAQLAAFRSAITAIPARRHSLANSAGIALGPAYAFNLTRPGLALYGGVPRAELARLIRPVALPQAAVIQLRQLAPGDAVGYNATFVASKVMRAATVSLGYADGILRCWGAGGAFAHNGTALPILGRVSMDMMVVECTATPDLREGDFVDLPYDLLENSRKTGLSQYELLTLLGRRFAR